MDTIMENKTQTVAELAPKILATLTPAQQQPITPFQQSEPQTERERAWLKKWLNLKTGDRPALLQLEREVWAFCFAFAKNPRAGYRLLIWGSNGAGKSHTAKAIHRWANAVKLKLPLDPIQNEDGDTYQLTTAQYLLWPKVVDGFKRGDWSVIDNAVEQSLVVLDDIGAEHDPSGIGREKLYYILERRECRFTVMTTNVPEPSWDVKFEKRIASRFLRNCVIVDLSGVPDFCA
jgi:DNA replication protein DnaC